MNTNNGENVSSIKKSILPKKTLIIFDLDGTILPNFTDIDEKIKNIISKLNKKKDVRMCIATGRNYLSTISVYEELKMNSFLITYNGAFINLPNKKNKKYNSLLTITNEIVREIINQEGIRENLLNIMIDNTDLESISTSEDVYYQEVFFNKNTYIKEKNIKELITRLEKKQEDCLQLVLEFENNTTIINEVIRILRGKFKDSISFYYGNKLKKNINEINNILIPDETKMIFKLRNKSASKMSAIKTVCSLYNLSPENNTISFGNDINDVDMLEGTWLGVAMLDSINNLKIYASDITKEKSINSGVAKYLEDLYDL